MWRPKLIENLRPNFDNIGEVSDFDPYSWSAISERYPCGSKAWILQWAIHHLMNRWRWKRLIMPQPLQHHPLLFKEHNPHDHYFGQSECIYLSRNNLQYDTWPWTSTWQHVVFQTSGKHNPLLNLLIAILEEHTQDRGRSCIFALKFNAPNTL